MLPRPLTWRHFWLRQWWRLHVSALLLSVRNCHAAWRCQQSWLFHCSVGQRGGNCWPRSEKISSVCSLYRRLDHLLSKRIQTFLWGFSVRGTWKFNLKLFWSPCARIEIFDVFKISHRKNFRSLNFRILEFYAKYAKFCTIWKFPAIRYQPTDGAALPSHTECLAGLATYLTLFPGLLTQVVCPLQYCKWQTLWSEGLRTRVRATY